ncbi:FAS-associated factor 2 [Clydaea vesicula]|uniref:FAS-associated factor 2 n=1 Tax=Clydaea vesicula TaxID=447962 RepID=A0AAD5U8E0_9FUNG|nr:FAS-associated factor 2 [Clydaea vesicula]
MDVEPKDRYLRLQHKLKKFSTNPLPDFLKGTYTEVLSQKIGNELRLLRQEQAEREHSRMIREQQDQAYKISLQKDQEKAKELEKEKEILKQKDQLKKEKLRRKENFKLDRKNLILELKRNQKSEPLLSNTTTKLSLRLPNGERIIRVFDLNDTLQDVLNYVLTLEFVELEWDYYLIRTFPKFEFNDLTLNLKDASLFPNGSLIVEKREFDELLDEELE